jgi:S-adenosyl-L-methionine hydrolase (adenosine-forming)
LIANEAAPEKVMEIQLPNAVRNAFPTANIFVKVACHIARGGTLEVVGKPFTALKALKEFSPRILEDGKQIIGSVIYIDNYGNVVTSIKKHHFEAYRNGRAFEIQVRNHKIRSIFKAYSDIEQSLGPKEKRRGDGDLLAIFNSSDYLELAIYRSNLRTVGGASTLLGLEYRDTITIYFG